MNFLNFDFKKTIVIICLLTLPLVSINSQKNPLDQGWFNQPFSFLASLVQVGFYGFSEGVRGTTSLYLNLINIKKDNQRLLRDNHELQSRLEALFELENENQRLNQLLDFKSHTKMNLTAARIMSKDISLDHNTIQIDKGTQHGLKSGQAVITVNGVVGYIFKPGLMTSQVLLITDRFAVVDGIISRSRARGIVEGKSKTHCTLRYVEKSEDVQPGDVVVTSGLDNIFPKGFPVAVIESIESKSYMSSLKIDLRPVVDPDKIEEVFIINDAKNEDLTPKETPTNKEESSVTGPSGAVAPAPNPSPAAVAPSAGGSSPNTTAPSSAPGTISNKQPSAQATPTSPKRN